ncbi:putative uncharacterized transposon-derived protein F52C9.6 [Varanus komodoensis]|nr:putative uncharacterized transposon-derived protein F52C9.6 [Varanus komodoensis]
MRKARLDESQVGIKIAGRNINNLRYADGTTLMAESEEELKSLLMRVKEESAKVGLKLNIKKTKIMASGPLTSWQIDGEEMEVCARWVLRMLMAPQKQVRVEYCKEFLELCEDPSSIFNWIVTGDETCIHHYDPESQKDGIDNEEEEVKQQHLLKVVVRRPIEDLLPKGGPKLERYSVWGVEESQCFKLYSGTFASWIGQNAKGERSWEEKMKGLVFDASSESNSNHLSRNALLLKMQS